MAKAPKLSYRSLFTSIVKIQKKNNRSVIIIVMKKCKPRTKLAIEFELIYFSSLYAII